MIKKNLIQTYLDQQSKLFGKELFSHSSKQYDKNLILSNKTQDLSDEITEFYRSISLCKKCSLGHTRNKFVFGNGDPNADLMLIGEAPDEKEDLEAKTFCGDVGVLLNKMLLAIKIKREKVYSTYSINFRPPNDRKPTTQEIKRYSIFLKEHISIIDPKILKKLFKWT